MKAKQLASGLNNIQDKSGITQFSKETFWIYFVFIYCIN